MNTEPNEDKMSQEPAPKTAHELVMEHISNPDRPITNEDIQDIDTSLADKPEQLTAEQKKDADGLADEIKKDDTGMSYTADL